MVALSTKLNERDETLVKLQNEIDLYEKLTKNQEDKINNLNNNNRMLIELLKKNNIAIPNELEYNENLEISLINNKASICLIENESKNVLSHLSTEDKIHQLKRLIGEKEKELENIKNTDNVHKESKVIKEKDTKVNYEKHFDNELISQNKILSEHNIILSNKCEELLEYKQRFSNKIKREVKELLENIYNCIMEDRNEKSYYLSQELLYIYKLLSEDVIDHNIGLNSTSKGLAQSDKELNRLSIKDSKIKINNNVNIFKKNYISDKHIGKELSNKEIISNDNELLKKKARKN